MSILFRYLIIFVLFIHVSPVFSHEEQLLLDLLSDIKDKDAESLKELEWLRAETSLVTEIATKTKSDSDLAPGIVSLLHGDELKKQGIRTVLEALTLVPGLDVVRSGDGAIQIIVRGIGRTFSSGKVRIMLNNVLLNSTMSGEPDAAIYLMPIEQVRRIEIIRGPGAALYGKWAYAGVINVITRQEENSVFARYGSFNERTVGGVFSFSKPESPLKVSLNITGWEKDRTDIDAGKDMLYNMENQSSISNAPGAINDAGRMFSGMLMLDYNALFLRAQYSTSSWGSFFGMADAMPPLNEEYTQTVRSHFLEGGYQSDISETLNLKILSGWREYILDMDNLYVFPAGFFGEDGMIIDPYYKGDSFYGEMNFQWSGWKNHLVLTGVEYEKVEISDSWSDCNYDLLTFAPLESVRRFQGDENWLDPGTERVILSFFAQDQFSLTDSLTFTAGIRYDDYNDTNDRLTPRLAGVFQASEHHMFKAQYGEGFRPPTFMEMYMKNNPLALGKADSPETVRTFELGYIFKTVPMVYRVTLFHSEFRDLIGFADGEYRNISDARSSGVELESKWKPFRSLMLDANLSYMDTQDKDTGEEIEGSVRWLGNAGILYQPLDNISFSFRYRHVGKRNRSPEDSRYKLKSYNTFNTSASIQNLFVKGFACNMGIRNLFNEDIRYPSALGGYEADYPQTGREWWIRLSYDF